MAEAILQERAQKYGRNVTAAAGVILVLAWVPGIKIDEFEPFGFGIRPGSAGELSIWCLLTGILVYYFVRFSVSLRIDYLTRLPDIRGYFDNMRRYKIQRKESIEKGIPRDTKRVQKNISTLRSQGMQVWEFYILEAGMPFFLFVAASFAAYVQIRSIWC